jgi:5-methylcytosine-specific restriction endonuclease McrA
VVRRSLPKEYRLSILERDDFLCRFCGNGGRNSDIILEVHHIVWKSHGGSDHPDNLIVVCRRCHLILHHGHCPYDAILTFTELRIRGGK